MEKTTALAPSLPRMDFVQPNFFNTVFPDTVKVRSMVPVSTEAPPRVAPEAKASTTAPEAEAVAAVLDFTVTPEGSAPTSQVQAVCVIPTYPVKGIVTSTADWTRPPLVQAMFCASFPRITDRPPEPDWPASPFSPSYILVMLTVSNTSGSSVTSRICATLLKKTAWAGFTTKVPPVMLVLSEVVG